MMSFTVKGSKALIKGIEMHSKQVRFAGISALSKTAVKAKQNIQKGMKTTFSNPTRFTINSVYSKPATKSDPSARVGLNDWAVKGRGAGRYLQPNIVGGHREDKRSEWLLRRRGLLPSGYQMVPSKYLRLNKFGNITAAHMNKILSGLSSQFDSKQNSAFSDRSKVRGQYFVANIKGTMGIWQRKGRNNRGIKPVFIFVKKPTYKKRFDWEGIAERTFDKDFEPIFNTQLKQAFRTAR